MLFRSLIGKLDFFSVGQRASVFLSHKHDEISQLKRVAYILENLHTSIYVDWLDNSMPRTTSGVTATIIKQQIEKYDKFILIATDGVLLTQNGAIGN